MGAYQVEEEVPQDEANRRVAGNGTAILLGILRGQLASITSCFPPGKFIIPSVNVQEHLKEAGFQVLSPPGEKSVPPRKKARPPKKSANAKGTAAKSRSEKGRKRQT